MPEFKFLKVKLLNGGQDGVELINKRDGDLPKKSTEECDWPAHIDFVTTVQKLAVHLAVLTGSIPEKKSHENKEVLKFTVTGYSIGGKEGAEGFTITGYRITPFGTVILNSPFRRFDQDPETAYSLIDEVKGVIHGIEETSDTPYINGIEDEGVLYYGGKRAPNPQQSLFDSADHSSTDHPDDDENDNKPKTKSTRKGKDKPVKAEAEETEFTPQQLEAHLASRKKNPGGKPRAEKPAVRKNPIK